MAKKSSKSAPPQSPASAQTGLLASCLYLAQHLQEKGVVDALQAMREPDDAEKLGVFFAQIQEKVRQAGLRSLAINLPWERVASLPECLPVVVEFKRAHYRVLTGLDFDRGQVELVMPQEAPTPQARPLEQFRQAWTGGVFLFERINTALVCFLLVAQSADLQLDQNRLEREYDLNRGEIPQNTLLKMAKDIGLQAEVWSCSWRDLSNLQQNWPAIGKLKNGQHVLLLEMTTDLDGASLIELYDPLTEDGHTHMTEQQFRDVWSGKVYLFAKRTGDSGVQEGK